MSIRANDRRSGSLIWFFLVSLLLLLTAFLLHYAFETWFAAPAAKPAALSEPRTVLLDAGHGGQDGGAVSVTGTPEKELNLSVTLISADLLRSLGYRVILTREKDLELRADGGGSRKMQDLKGRLLLAEANPGAPFLSFHMNKFPQGKYHGLQVYYARRDPASRPLAEAIQSAVKQVLQPDNERAVKPATSAIFLLDNITSPAVLIECGFLSNEAEAKRLEDPVYQTELALTVVSAFAAWDAARPDA